VGGGGGGGGGSITELQMHLKKNHALVQICHLLNQPDLFCSLFTVTVM